jgi:DNA mismatch repair protein MutH
MSDRIYESKEELFSVAKSSIGKTIGTYDFRNRLVAGHGKGKIGLVLEEGLFEHTADNKQEPDFANLGIELKVTGYRWTNQNSKVSAKERLVITMLDYFKDPLKTFNESNVFHKIAQMLLLLYEFEVDKNEADFLLTNYYFYEFEKISEIDKSIIIRDYENIISKIKNNKAHEISEGDTFYLAACTKGANSSSTVTLNGIEVMKRAYAFKPTYMTYIMRNNIFVSGVTKESFIKDIKLLRNNSLEGLIYKTFEPYVGMTLTEIDSIISKPIKRANNKQYLRNYVSRIMKVDEDNLNNIDEFLKANIQIKTIRISKKGSIDEHMSFPNFDFIQLSEETWEESETRELFEIGKFLFVVFEEIDDLKLEYKLKSVKLWNMPLSVLDTEVKSVWVKTKAILNSELIVDIKKNRFYNNFPSTVNNEVAHVRPHGQDSYDVFKLPEKCMLKVRNDDGSKSIEVFIQKHAFTKQCFWLNNSYILKIVEDYK